MSTSLGSSRTYRYVSYENELLPFKESDPVLAVSANHQRSHSRTFLASVDGLPPVEVTLSIKDDEVFLNGKHCHAGSSSKIQVDKRARRKLLIATCLCLVFMVGEAVGGILANSLAIATDAAHLLSDFSSFVISLAALHIASRPATKRMSFGWYRAEVMGAIISVLLIWVVTGILVYMAVLRVISDNYEIGGVIMVITAGCAVGFNILMGATLYDSHSHSHFGGGHNHSHNADHGHSHKAAESFENSAPTYGTTDKEAMIESGKEAAGGAKTKGNINVRAAFIHVVGDFLQSIGVLIAAIIIYFKPEWKIVDPICTFIFSILVLFTTVNILRETLHVLMEGTPRGMSFNDVRDKLQGLSGVRELHNLRIWSLTVNKVALAVHLAVDPMCNQQEVVTRAAIMMRDEFDVVDCTIQIEEYVDEMDECQHCRDPLD